MLSVLAAALAAAGCGGGSHDSSSSVAHAAFASTSTSSTAAALTPSAARPASICTPAGLAAITRFLRVSPASISTHAATANSSYPECLFTARADGRTVRVTLEVDTEPAAYAVLERTIIEQSQPFPQRLHPAPQHVGRLGLDASWFPEQQQLMTTDAVRLVIATIGWPSAPQARKVALAVAAAHPYLGRLEPKLARGPAP